MSNNHVVVIMSLSMWPASPRAVTETLPLGLISTQVRLACFRLMRSQASGGSCRARQKKYLKEKKGN